MEAAHDRPVLECTPWKICEDVIRASDQSDWEGRDTWKWRSERKVDCAIRVGWWTVRRGLGSLVKVACRKPTADIGISHERPSSTTEYSSGVMRRRDRHIMGTIFVLTQRGLLRCRLGASRTSERGQREAHLHHLCKCRRRRRRYSLVAALCFVATIVVMLPAH